MQKLVVTGGSGFVAGGVIQQAGREWEVHALSRKEPLTARAGLAWHTLSPDCLDEYRQSIETIRPAVVLHTAANGDIDFCEKNPATAQLVNVALTQALAEACRHTGSRLIFLSTDTVFDGKKGNYVESDLPSPINEYARTKAAGEKIVGAAGSNSLVVRVSVVMGLALLGRGNSFLERTIPMLREGAPIYVPPEEIRTPIDVITLGRALLELAAANCVGTLHLAGTEPVDRVSMTCRLARRLGYSTDRIFPRLPEQIIGRAARPRDVSLCTAKAQALLRTPLLDFDASLDQILNAPMRPH